MHADRGIVDDRQLVAVQTFDISRLTTHPVVIRPGTFIAVSGAGPKGDSNGSGKTSFLAAVSVLLADPQWNLAANGGKHAAGLLFRPDAAGLDPSLRITPAPHGYIAAVFADPSEVRDSALTVWVRIAATAPYVQARWVPGLHVATADSDDERARQADDLWQALRQQGPISAREMARTLFGDAPRCLSYLDTVLRPSIPSLLSQEMTRMSPREIGGALIALAGQADQLADENRERNKLLELQGELNKAEHDAAVARVDEDAQLSAITAREDARTLLHDATTAWTRLAAHQYLTALARDAQLAITIAERQEILEEQQAGTTAAETELKRLRAMTDLAEREKQARRVLDDAGQTRDALKNERTAITVRQDLLIKERNALLNDASRWKGDPTAAQAKIDLDAAVVSKAGAQAVLDASDAKVTAAELAVVDAQAGCSGLAGRLAGRLRTEAGIAGAVALADVLDVDTEARDVWEPRLHAFRDAIAVPEEHAAPARLALRDEPGAQVIAASPAGLTGPRAATDGIHYPPGLQPLISGLARRLTVRPDPARADDDALGASVLGGFRDPIVGRDALVQQAERDLMAAQESREQAAGALQTAAAKLTLAEDQDRAARAGERVAAIKAELGTCADQIAELDPRIGTAEQTFDAAQEALTKASSLRSSHDTSVELAALQLKGARALESDASAKLGQAQTERAGLPVEAWRREIGGSQEDAERLCTPPSGGTPQRPQTLLRQAAEGLLGAINVFRTDGGFLAADLANADGARREFAEQQADRLAEPVPFELAATLVRDRLRGFAEYDSTTRARIEEVRERREHALGQLRVDVAAGSTALVKVQDMIEHTVDAALRRVSGAFDRTAEFGAALDVSSTRPDGVAPWHWEVTPRWRRSPGGGLVSYKENANSAQVKVLAIQLVLAALLADAQTTGRILVLDELGNSLGDVNRRDVLESLQKVAEQQQVTILGTCQDSVLADAADFCGELIWFTHAAATDAYNQPTRVWGHDSLGERVELTADWLRAGRDHV